MIGVSEREFRYWFAPEILLNPLSDREVLMPGYGVIQGLWIGEVLSSMERLSIASFLAQGHEYHLYVYGTVSNVPPGTCLRDAREVLPESMIFQYTEYPSYAGFADHFRYKLLLDHGGWWADTDAVCLRPFDFPPDYVFSSELTAGGDAIPTNGFIKAPAGSEAMVYAWEQCRIKDPRRLTWGENGPRLVAEAIRRYSLGQYLQDPATFTPIAHFDWERIIEPGRLGDFTASTRAVHLWNEKWRCAGRDKNARYPQDCLYERLKALYFPTDSVP